MKIRQIIEGYFNLATNKESELSIYRLSICKPCEHRKGKRCGICGCILTAKSRSPKSKCPKEKWNTKENT